MFVGGEGFSAVPAVFLVSSALRPGRLYMPCRHEKEKHSKRRPCQSGLFLSKVRLNITQHLFKMKWQGTCSRTIIIELSDLFNDLFAIPPNPSPVNKIMVIKQSRNAVQQLPFLALLVLCTAQLLSSRWRLTDVTWINAKDYGNPGKLNYLI